MSEWRNKAKKIAAGKWIRFDAANPQHTLLFVGEPSVVDKVSQSGPTKGEKYQQMSFPVVEDGEERILEPNKSLLTQLIEEDEESPIVGCELWIKCLNPEKKTSWKVKRINGGKEEIQTWKGNEKDQDKGEDEEGRTNPSTPDTKDKEKFMMEVKKKSKAKKEKAKENTEEEETHAE